MSSTFTLEVVMDGNAEDKGNSTTSPLTLITMATSIRILRDQQSDPRTQQFIAAMIPHTMVESSLQRAFHNPTASKSPPSNSESLWLEESDRMRLSRDLLPRIHPIFKTNNQQQQQRKASVLIRAVFTTNGMAQHSPADVVLLDESASPSELLEVTNGDAILEDPNAILKLLIVSQVHIAYTPLNLLASESEIPLCPVCLHRIDPARLGLPKPFNRQLCSKFCPVNDASETAANTMTSTTPGGCPKQRFLKPWPEPSHCIACRVIQDYQTAGSAANSTSVYCNQCALQTTLWVCLTCGFCGCGRYSNKHAAAHFKETGHSYSLELATLRIWDYANGGEFVHRGDLLECPAGRQQRARALQVQQEIAVSVCMGPEGASPAAHVSAATMTALLSTNSSTSDWRDQLQPYHWNDQGDEKSPKKAVMIGEEYEALLQSALEDQAQHYQGDISRLRAALTAEQIDLDFITNEEAEAIEKLKSEILKLRKEADRVGRDLLDAQAQEAGHRAESQGLLREQQVAQDLLKTIQEEANREQEQGKREIEDLEQQIADLAANLHMRHQFSQDRELANAQIFGTLSSPDQAKTYPSKKGKLRRLFRR